MPLSTQGHFHKSLALLLLRFVLFKTQQAAAVAAQSIILAEDNYEFTVGDSSFGTCSIDYEFLVDNSNFGTYSKDHI